jgi:2'-5' RNA ligase
MSELIRAFVAIDVSDRVRAQIGELLAKLKKERESGVRWVRPEVMHLTLAFLGEVKPDFIESSKRQLEQVVPQFRQFETRMAGLGAFPTPSRARVVWVGMEHGKAELCRVQAAVAQALKRIGFQPERRPFSPHLTLGRLREPGDVSPVVVTPFESEPFAIDRLILFRSVLRPEAPEYVRLAEFPFPAN